MRAKDAKVISVYLFELKTKALVLNRLHTDLNLNDTLAGLLYSYTIKQFISDLYRIRDLERSMFLKNKISLGVDPKDLNRITEVRNQLFHGDYNISYDSLISANELFEISNRISNALFKQLPPNIQSELYSDTNETSKEVNSNVIIIKKENVT